VMFDFVLQNWLRGCETLFLPTPCHANYLGGPPTGGGRANEK
jgi:hypothetical protein